LIFGIRKGPFRRKGENGEMGKSFDKKMAVLPFPLKNLVTYKGSFLSEKVECPQEFA
jgi:hypothetical protein